MLQDMIPRKLLFVGLILLIASCQPGNEQDNYAQVPEHRTITPALQETVTSTSTKVVPSLNLATPTHTIVSTSPTSTQDVLTANLVSPTVVSTDAEEPLDMVLPTLSTDNADIDLRTLLETNANCTYPCFWGITPNLSTLEELERLSLQLDVELTTYDSGGINIYKNMHITFDNSALVALNIGFAVNQDDIVEDITVLLWKPSRYYENYPQGFANFNLGQIFAQYGLPESIDIHITPRVEKDDIRLYILWLRYQDDVFSIRYEGVITSENPIMVCLNSINDPKVFSIELYLESGATDNALKIHQEKLKALETVTEYSITDFYEFYVNSDDLERCFEVADE